MSFIHSRVLEKEIKNTEGGVLTPIINENIRKCEIILKEIRNRKK